MCDCEKTWVDVGVAFLLGYFAGQAGQAPIRKGPRRKSHISKRRRRNPLASLKYTKSVEKVKP